MNIYKSTDANIQNGQIFAYTYDTMQPDFQNFIVEAYSMFNNTNALNPSAYPSLLRFENEIVRMCLNLLNGDEKCVGTLTSGGTESVLMAVKTYRDRARDLFGITQPEIILPITAHPAFEKGGLI